MAIGPITVPAAAGKDRRFTHNEAKKLAAQEGKLGELGQRVVDHLETTGKKSVSASTVAREITETAPEGSLSPLELAMLTGSLGYSTRVLGQVMEEFGLADSDTLLAQAVENVDDGNVYLNRSELRAAALSLQMPADWRGLLKEEFSKPYFKDLAKFLANEWKSHHVLPATHQVFAALHECALDDTRVVLIGQDPYPTPGHANGLAFSVASDVRPLPGSLRNLFVELEDDLGVARSEHGDLHSWANHGMLLLNTVLTVRAGDANSHRDHGWEQLTSAIFSKVNERDEPSVFLTLGSQAKGLARDIVDTSKHRIVSSSHPSPLSAHYFLGSKPFSRVDAALTELGYEPFAWRL